MKPQKRKIAFITNKSYENSETFIKAQMDQLSFDIMHYWGHKIPLNLKAKEGLIFKIFKKLKLINPNYEHTLGKDWVKNKVQVIIAQYGTTAAVIFPVCKKLQLPLVIHFHGHDAVRKSVLEHYKAAYNAMFEYNKTLVVSVSHEMTRNLIKIGCPEEKIVYNPYGPNPKFALLELTFSKPQFIAIGRFVEKKAPHLTILAFHKVWKKFPNSKLIFAGSGGLLDSCKDLVQALKMQDNVVFPGRITPDQYAAYIEESAAFVQHSITAQDGDMEGTPVAILEASGAGLPIISTHHAGIPDVILHNETGLIAPEKEIDQMAQNMIWVLENKELAIKMGAKGKERISTYFSMDRYISKLEHIIDSSFKA